MSNRREHDPHWNQEFRYDGMPADPRHGDMIDAEACKRRVKNIAPGRPRARKERSQNGRRQKPSPITYERMNHSKGKKWEEFEESLGGNLSEREKLLLLDSRKHGGNEVFATWRQRQVEGWSEVGRCQIFVGPFTDWETGEVFKDGRFIFQVDPETGERRTVSWERKLTPREREVFLPVSHPLHPHYNGSGGSGKSRRGSAPVANVGDLLKSFDNLFKK